MIPPPRTPCTACICCQAQTYDNGQPLCLPCRDGVPCAFVRNRGSYPPPEVFTMKEPKAKRGRPYIVKQGYEPIQPQRRQQRKTRGPSEKAQMVRERLRSGDRITEIAASLEVSAGLIYKVRRQLVREGVLA